jgi:N-acetylneuraminic acid mutarotase
VAPQPFSNSEGQSVTVGGKLYSFGGFDSTKPCCTPTRRAYVYDPAANTWTAIAEMPKGVTHGGIATDGTEIFYAGGYIENAAQTGQIFGTKQVWRYSPATNTYTALPDLPVERAGGGLAFLDGQLHYVGGTNLARTQDVTTHYVLDVAGGAAAWTTAAPLPIGRHHLGMAAIGGALYVVGGQQGHDGALVPRTEVDAYDPASDTWTTKAPISPARNHHGSTTVVVNERIVVMGGQINHGQSVSNVSEYDPETDIWRSLPSLPAARHSAVGGYLDGALYFSTGGTAGGYKGTVTFSAAPLQALGFGETVPANRLAGLLETATAAPASAADEADAIYCGIPT